MNVSVGPKASTIKQNGALVQAEAEALNVLPTEEELLTCDCPFCVAYRGRSGTVRGIGSATPSCAAKSPATTAVAGAKPAPALLTAPLKDPLAQGFKATAVIGISCKVSSAAAFDQPPSSSSCTAFSSLGQLHLQQSSALSMCHHPAAVSMTAPLVKYSMCQF